MDIVIVLIIMAVLYIIPELLRRKNPKEYRYPEIPDVPELPKAPPLKRSKVPPDCETEFTRQRTENSSSYGITETNKISAASPALSSITSERTILPIDQNQLLNGIIWAEILLPARAYRPLHNKTFPRR